MIIKKYSKFLLFSAIVLVGFFALLPLQVEAKTTCTEVYIESEGQIDSDIGGATYSSGGSWGCMEDFNSPPSGSSSDGFVLEAGFDNGGGSLESIKTVAPGESVTVYGLDSFASSRSGGCPLMTATPAWYFSAGWQIPGTNYSTAFSSGMVGLLGTKTTRIYPEWHSWTYEGSEVTPVLNGSSNSLSAPSGWQFGSDSQSWSFNAPTDEGTYLITIVSATHIDTASSNILSDCTGGYAFHEYALKSAEAIGLTLIVESPSEPSASSDLLFQNPETLEYSGSGFSKTSSSAVSVGLKNVCENADSGTIISNEGFSRSFNTGGSSYYEYTVSDSIQANSGSTKTVTYSSTCVNSSSTGDDAGNVSVTNPAGSPSINLSSTPSTVNEGETYTLNWDSENISGSLSKSGSWSTTTAGNVEGTQTYTAPSVDLDITRTYTLSGQNSNGVSATATATVDILNVPQATITIIHAAASQDSDGATFDVYPSVTEERLLLPGESQTFNVNPGPSGTVYTLAPSSASIQGFDNLFISGPNNSGEINTSAVMLSDGDSVIFAFYYTDDEVTPDNTATITVTSNLDTSYILAGTANPTSFSESITANSTDTHGVTFTPGDGSSESYALGAADIDGYTKEVSPESNNVTLTPGSIGAFTITYTEIPEPEVPTYSATINVESLDIDTCYTLTDASGDESISDCVDVNYDPNVNSDTNTHTVSPDNGSEIYTLTPTPVSGAYFEVTNNKSGGTDGVVTVADGDNITFYTDLKGGPGSCIFEADNTTVEQGETFTLTWVGDNLSFATAIDDTPTDGIWGSKAVNTSGGSETITAPQVQSGSSDTYEYNLLCGYRNNTRETKTVTITVTRPAEDATLQATSNLDTTYSISPSVTSDNPISADATESFTVSPGFDGVTYTASFDDKPGYSESVVSTVEGTTAGTSSNSSGSATVVEGETASFAITYTPVSCSIDMEGPSSVNAGGNIALSWTSEEVSGSLTGSGTGFVGSKSANDSETIDAPEEGGTYTYTLEGTSGTSDCSDSVTVQVTPRTVPADISVTTNRSTYYTISGVTSNNYLSIGSTETRNVTPETSGTTYTVSASSVEGEQPTITNNLSGDSGGGNDVVLVGGEDVTFTLTYPNSLPSVSASL